MYLLEVLKILLLSFTFAMIYIIHKMSISNKNILRQYSISKDSIFECFFKEYKRLLFLSKKDFFSKHIIMENLSLEQEDMIKDIRNLFSKEKETKVIKDRILRNIKNLFDLEE